MKVGDLVRTKADPAEWCTDPSEPRDFHVVCGLVVEKRGYQVWVRWASDGYLAWMPKQNLEVVSEGG